ncbi:MAG: DUF4058 family protein [Fimbriimonadales bacterium]|nr:DUF4058 family protein [Fimbriimonadales bacterium]
MVQHRIVGMDPYIEAQAWRDFHLEMISGIRAALIPHLVPKYAARIEERVYIDEEASETQVRYPDVAVEVAQPNAPYAGGGVATLVEPVLRSVPLAVEQRERFIEIRTLPERKLVTVIEMLSPTNKRPNSTGRRVYLRKRRQLFEARVNLVELDLTLQGERMPTNEPLPEGDYFALIARGYRLPVVEVYAWKRGQPLPLIPVPLLRGDPDAPLNLQAVYESVYARARYDVQLDFSKPLPFAAAE